MGDYDRWKLFNCIGQICHECYFENDCKMYVAEFKKELSHKETKKEGCKYD